MRKYTENEGGKECSKIGEKEKDNERRGKMMKGRQRAWKAGNEKREKERKKR